MGSSTAATTVTASTMTMTQGDLPASVTRAIQPTEYFLVGGFGNRKIIPRTPYFIGIAEKVLCLGCRDLDECSEGGKECGKNTDCINTDGGHHCVCQIGFEGDPCETLGT